MCSGGVSKYIWDMGFLLAEHAIGSQGLTLLLSRLRAHLTVNDLCSVSGIPCLRTLLTVSDLCTVSGLP
jgi:hypothetical protein